MTPEQAKDLLPIIKAYSEGKQIQLQSLDNKLDWVDLAYPHFVAEPERYRVKPDPIVVKYRRYLYKRSKTRYYVDVCYSDGDVNLVKNLSNFIRWIDTDWITENV